MLKSLLKLFKEMFPDPPKCECSRNKKEYGFWFFESWCSVGWYCPVCDAKKIAERNHPL